VLNSFIKKKLEKLEKSNPAIRSIVPLSKAESIGILFDYNLSESNQKIIKKWAKWLREKGKTVQLCEVKNSKLKKGENINTSPLELHSNHFNIFGKPKVDEGIVFMHTVFDYLVTFQMDPGKEVNWLSAGSKAKVRIGLYEDDNKLPYCDLYIKSNKEGLENYIDKLENTVENINE
jgi:hypothetical protein